MRGGRNLGWDLTEIRRVLGAFHHRVETERRRMLVDMQNNPAWTFRRNPDERVDVIHTSSPDVIKVSVSRWVRDVGCVKCVKRL